MLITSRSPLNDAELMRRVQGDCSDAFATLYDRHATVVFGLARRIVLSRELAEDVTQETFVAAWRSRHSYSAARGEARSWLLTIARNRAIDAVRKRSGDDFPLAADYDPEAPERTDTDALHRIQAAAVALAVDGLPARQREIIDLAYAQGLTQTEIALRLSVPLGTVKGRARLALNRLRLELDDRGMVAA